MNSRSRSWLGGLQNLQNNLELTCGDSLRLCTKLPARQAESISYVETAFDGAC